MIDIKAVYSSDAFSLVKGPSSAIARVSSIAEYGHLPMAFHHIVAINLRPPPLEAFVPLAHATVIAWVQAGGAAPSIQALAHAIVIAWQKAVAAGGRRRVDSGLGRRGKNP